MTSAGGRRQPTEEYTMTEMSGAGPPRPTSFRAGPPTPRPADGGEYQAPSRALATRATATAVDARGRAITARKLSLLDYYKLTKILGEDAKNERSMDLASPAGGGRA